MAGLAKQGFSCYGFAFMSRFVVLLLHSMRVSLVRIILVCWLFTPLGLTAQLLVQPIANPQQIAQGIVGPGVVVFNPVLDCAPGGAGGFIGTASVVPIDTGLILSTGLATSAMPPVQGPTTGQSMGFPGDTLLSLQADTVQSYDKCVFRFKAIPMSSFMTIRYSFASDEYPEKVCCPDRDQFGIFVSGANPNPIPPLVGATYNYFNVCLNTNVNPPFRIEMATVNGGVAGPGCFCPPSVPQFPNLYIDNPNSLTEEFDGLTVNLEAIFPVVPCDTYDIRLAVADIFDDQINSALLIESSSLSSGGYGISSTVTSGDTFIVEGCSPGQITIDRDARDTAATQILLSYGGTAINGIDVTTLPTSPSFASQSSTLNIPVNAIPDNTVEGEEDLIVYLLHPCTGSIMDSTILYIRDELPVEAFPDTVVCSGSPVQLLAIGAANFNWSPPTYLNNPNSQAPVAEPEDTIIYVVTGTSGNCTNTDTITIITQPLPDVDAGNDTIVCFGTTGRLKGDIEAGVTPSWSPPAGLSSPNVADPLVFTQQSGRYILTAISPEGCFARDTMIYRVNPRPTMTTNQLVFVCPGDTAILTAAGVETYVWAADPSLLDTVGDTVRAVPVANTSYSVTGFDSLGCPVQSNVLVRLRVPPTIVASVPSPICEGDTVLGAATGALTYTWLPSAGVAGSPGSTTPLSPSQTTVFTVVGIDNNGCVGTDTASVAVRPAPSVQATVSANPVCIGDTVTLQANGGVSYVWSGPVWNASAATTQAVISDTTVFVLTGSDNIGCTASDTITVHTFSQPSISTGASDSICAGDSIVLVASGGVQYSWLPSGTLSDPASASPTATPATTTQYTVTVVNANGCEARDSTTLVVIPLPSLTVSGPVTLCDGDSVVLQATGTAGYQWSPSATLSCTNCPDPMAYPGNDVTYTVVGTDDFGCTVEGQHAITVHPLPPVSASSSASAICQGDTVVLQANGAITYTWSPTSDLISSTGSIVQAVPITGTIFTVWGTDANGCQNSDTAGVRLFVDPIVSGGANDTICIGQSISLQASGGSSYQWLPATGLSNPTIANPVASPVTSTTYTVTISDANGCVATATKHIEVVTLPAVDAGNDVSLCAGDTVMLSATGANSYTWSGTTDVSCLNCRQPSFYGSQTTTLVVEGFIGQGCSATDTVTVTVNALPQVEAGPDTAVCVGTTLPLTASGAATYTWVPATGLSNPAIPNPVATITNDILYVVAGEDVNGCTALDSISVVAHPLPNVSTAGDTTICENTVALLQAFGAQFYSWSPVTGVADPNAASTTASPSASTTYTVTGTDGNGCTNTATQSIALQQAPNLTISPAAATLCPGESVLLTVTGGNTYQWSPAAGLSSTSGTSVIASPTQSTTYTVSAASTAGCAATGTIDIVVQPVLNPSAQPDSASICEGEYVLLAAQQGASYQWSPTTGLDDPTISSPTATPTSTTTYTIILTDAVGCTFTDSVFIRVYPAAIADAGIDQAIYAGESVSLKGSGNGAFSWSPSASLDNPFIAQPLASPADDQMYTLTVTTNGGCMAIDTTFIDVLYQTVVYVPTGFSPNGDGQNDVIRLRSFNQFELDVFEVYDRWGQLVFRTEDPSIAWDGTHHGKPLQMGTYIYFVRGTGNLGEPIRKQGNITLIR